MIVVKTVEQGSYSLIEIQNHANILMLDKRQYLWSIAEGIEEISATSRKQNDDNDVLSRGKYRLYMAIDEPGLDNHQHLELHMRGRIWQCYILPEGLPTARRKKVRIVATPQVISVPKGSG